MCKRLCLFAGTTEGRELAVLLAASPSADVTACVATEYGEVLLEGIEGLTVRAGRMDEPEMEAFFSENRFDSVIDATHPYAALVSENIRVAAAKAGIPVLRILREDDREIPHAVYVSSVAEARDYLAGREGNIFLTTGAKELSSYSGLDMNRVWARVLPTASSLESCAAAGIPAAHIIAAQGPFSEEINRAQMNAIGAKYMVTKASGKSGGFEEKIRAAKSAGALPVIIGRPPETEGLFLADALRELGKELPLGKAKVTVVGSGPGAENELTGAAKRAIAGADAIFGARSAAEPFTKSKAAFYEFMPEKILAALDGDPTIRRAAVLMRGDTGFYSGAKKLAAALGQGGYEIEILPGVSSVSAFAAKLGKSWDDAALVSLHGRDGEIALTVSENRRTFALTGGKNTVGTICERLSAFGLGSARVWVGERLSYPDERVTEGLASELAGREDFDALSLCCIENEGAARPFRFGIPDEEFIRGDVPMTKSEVRAVTLSKLAPPHDAVIWDVGAGTGSVSVECALAARGGRVYAVEKEADAAELIRQNRFRFQTENLTVVEGTAPDALRELPAPTHVFIGGSSGSLADIVAAVLEKNPAARIVINAVTLDTQAEAVLCAKRFGFETFDAVSLSAARSRKVGRVRMMTAQNPVMIYTFENSAASGTAPGTANETVTGIASGAAPGAEGGASHA